MTCHYRPLYLWGFLLGGINEPPLANGLHARTHARTHARPPSRLGHMDRLIAIHVAIPVADTSCTLYMYWPSRLSQSAVSFIGSLGYPLLSQGVLKGSQSDSSKFLKTISIHNWNLTFLKAP